MPANIAQINGSAAIAYLDAPPWHGMGNRLQLKDIPRHLLVDAAVDAAGLRWTVGSVPLYLADGSEVKGFKASVRYASDGSGTVAATFGPVGDGYVHSQNLENVDILRPLVEDFGCVPATAGALDDGRRCWMLVRLADAKLSPLPGDDVNGYFLLSWGHDGNLSVAGRATPIRVVCQNTLSAATDGQRAWFSIRHTSSVAARRDQAADLMRKLMESLKATGDTFAQMAGKNLSAAELDAYINAAIPNTSGSKVVSPVVIARRDTVSRLVFYGRGAAMANQGANTAAGEASVWAAYNAVTEYYDHCRTAEAQSPAGLKRAQESAIFGGNSEIKAQAFQLARELVAV